MRTLRDGLPPDDGTALAAHLAAYFGYTLPHVVGGYWPLGSEIDPRPTMAWLHARGVALALPETPPQGAPLRFRVYLPGEPLVIGRYGTQHPLGAEIVPDLLLVPLLAFDRRGHRLGYGGGYFDRTLSAWPATRAIGCAYAAQELDAIPTGPYDRALHAIATERGVIET